METSRVDGVDAPQHLKTRRSHTCRSPQALQKWKATIYEASMPPEAIIKALQERVARQRMLKEKFENELEAIVRSRRPVLVSTSR